MFLFLEFAEKGSLQAFIHKHKLHTEFGLDLILQWAKDIALGMNYLHEEALVKIIHRDLKSTNVVISKDMICKLCDFGTSVFSLKTTKMSLIGYFDSNLKLKYILFQFIYLKNVSMDVTRNNPRQGSK